ncbi:Sec1-like protein [Dunaliella salina]|uniref:Sec1-like protein n=1 Tax=Dunaliella salina TaxID=3046 RepID=A0ABQ7GRI1_DUNSA|nr:Sec1-like protein [Dunaliella salina]|eukprot:KAF5837210.1 Sec1-like protein [Dunaliella salina]
MGGFNIRQKQADVLVRVINLNNPLAPGKDPGDLYKVLVLDRFTKDIVAPLLRLNDLRRNGVTLHLMLEAERQPIPDVPAVYLVQPSTANAERIIADAAAGLYEAMHLNFTSSIPSRTLESIAAGTVRAGAAHRIAKLYDQYVAFIALEPSLFSLGQPNCYVELNDPSAKDTQIEEVETQLQKYRASVDDINKHSAAGAREGVYVDPDELIRRNTHNLMAAVSSLPELQEQKRTLDKHTNLATSLLAAIKARGLDGWHNGCEDVLCGKSDLGGVLKLVHDVLGMKLNRIVLSANEPSPAGGVGGSHEALAGLAGNQPTGQAALFDWADKTLGQGLSHVTKSVKTLLSGARQPPLVGAVEALAEGRAGSPEFESYAVFDPKAPPGRAGLDRAKGPFKECIVFMIGAGSYAERESLMTWAARSGAPAAGVPGAIGGVGGVGGGSGPGGRHLIYGATDILQGQELLAQLAELGRRCGVGPGGVELAPQQAPAN